VDERGKIDVLKRALAAWNSGDLGGVVAELSEDHEWDLTRSDIPGESEVHRGHAGFLQFAQHWREALGPTQSELDEAKELPDGRLFALIKTWGTGARSGAEVDLHYVQIATYEGDKMTRSEIFTDHRKGRAAASLDP
jgi:ketosteroid isomerase-like protein